jgi:hypothetical protein
MANSRCEKSRRWSPSRNHKCVLSESAWGASALMLPHHTFGLNRSVERHHPPHRLAQSARADIVPFTGRVCPSWVLRDRKPFSRGPVPSCGAVAALRGTATPRLPTPVRPSSPARPAGLVPIRGAGEEVFITLLCSWKVGGVPAPGRDFVVAQPPLAVTVCPSGVVAALRGTVCPSWVLQSRTPTPAAYLATRASVSCGRNGSKTTSALFPVRFDTCPGERLQYKRNGEVPRQGNRSLELRRNKVVGSIDRAGTAVGAAWGRG